MSSQTAVPPKGAAGQPQTNPIIGFVPMLVVIAILYILIIRPQQKQAKEHKSMLDALKTGDKVVTQGGIHGTVAALKGAIVSVKIADNVRIDVSRSAISQIVKETAANSPVVEVKG